MKKHDLVFVRPTTSLKFGKRWGVISKVVPADGLPFKVQFHDSPIPYGFSSSDLVDETTFTEWVGVGRKVYNILNDSKEVVTKSEYHFVYTEKLCDPIHFTDVLPITDCEVCNTEMIGELSYVCEDCIYGGVNNG